VNYAALNGDDEFRYNFCDYIMTPVVYTSFYTTKNGLAVAPESPPSRKEQPAAHELKATDRFFY
jgi:hypothetical protein